MLSAATNHAVIDTSLTMKALRITEVMSRIKFISLGESSPRMSSWSLRAKACSAPSSA